MPGILALLTVTFATVSTTTLLMLSAPAQPGGASNRTLPPDAAPLARQTLRMMSPEPRSLDAQVNLYDAEATLLPWEPLLTRDEMWQPQPATAERYSASKDGKTWTFYLRRGAKWSDGRPVTANDFVYAFRRMLDPAAANPYASFYYDIRNAEAISKGTLKDTTLLGVRAADEATFVVETERPAPYFPHIASFPLAYPAPRWAIEKHGRRWTEVDKIVSSSPFKMSEWVRGSHMTFVADPNYNGPKRPYLQKVVHPFRDDAVATILPYENNEVDIESVDINELDRIQKHPVLSKELVKAWGRTTWYILFKTTAPPFNDIRVREAFARVLDRDAICRTVLRNTAMPAYSMIPPDFKEYNGAVMKPVQSRDIARAQQLMKDAGFPGGRGFPKQEMWLRAPTPSITMVASAIQSMLREHLNVEVTIRTADRTAYMSQLYDWKMNFGLIRFVADYVDPRNMLDMTWRSQPRGVTTGSIVGLTNWSNKPAPSFPPSHARNSIDKLRRFSYATTRPGLCFIRKTSNCESPM